MTKLKIGQSLVASPNINPNISIFSFSKYYYYYYFKFILVVSANKGFLRIRMLYFHHNFWLLISNTMK